MKLKQLSIFLENKPGHLNEICKTLTNAKINVITLSLADTEQFGIVRLIVKDADTTKQILEKAGFVVNINEVIAVEVVDHAGSISSVLQALEGVKVNIEYMYAFSYQANGQAILIFRFDKPDLALVALKKAGQKISSLEHFSY